MLIINAFSSRCEFLRRVGKGKKEHHDVVHRNPGTGFCLLDEGRRKAQRLRARELSNLCRWGKRVKCWKRVRKGIGRPYPPTLIGEKKKCVQREPHIASDDWEGERSILRTDRSCRKKKFSAFPLEVSTAPNASTSRLSL